MSKIFNYILTFTFLISFLLARGQWHYVNPTPSPGWYTAIDFVDSQLGFALGNEGDLVRTQDGGVVWHDFSPALPIRNYCTDMQFAGPDTAVITCAEGVILITSDGGRSWGTVASGTGEDLRAVWMVDGRVGYIVGNKGVLLKSSDGGLNWTLLSTPGFKNGYDVQFTNRQTGFVATGKEVLKSTDGGINWTTVLHSDTIWSFTRLFFLNDQYGWVSGPSGTLFATLDGGQSWQRRAFPVGINLQVLWFSSATTGVAGGAGGSLWLTTDGGTIWNQQNTGTTWDLRAIAFADENHGTIAGILGGLIGTTDAGHSWQPVNFATLNHLTSVDFDNPDRGCAAGVSGTIIRTTNGGVSWETVASGTGETINAICAPAAGVYYAAGTGSTFLKSVNGGATWTRSSTTVAGNWQSVSFVSDQRGYLAGGGPQVLRTINGGGSWTPLMIPSAGTINDVEFHLERGYACGAGGSLFTSGDGGDSWQSIVIPEFTQVDLVDAACFDDKSAAVVGNLATAASTMLYYGHTIDGGETWRIYTFDLFDRSTFYSVALTSPQTAYVTGGDFIWKSMDGGASWLDQTPSYRPGGFLGIAFSDAERGYAAGYFGQLVRTTNGGGTGAEEVPRVNESWLGQPWPNPATATVSVRLTSRRREEVVVRFTDLTGSTVGRPVTYAVQPGENILQVRIPSLSPGVYLLRVVCCSASACRKVIVSP